VHIDRQVWAACAGLSPDEYLFWYGLHSTASVNGISAQRAAAVLGQ
jgi:hypothetical protein